MLIVTAGSVGSTPLPSVGEAQFLAMFFEAKLESVIRCIWTVGARTFVKFTALPPLVFVLVKITPAFSSGLCEVNWDNRLLGFNAN